MKSMDDKKKLIMLGALAAVILAVGAFQFISKGKPEQAPTPSGDPAVASDSAKDGAVQIAPADAKKDAEKNNLVAGSFPTRDPFKPIILAGNQQPVVYQPIPPARPPLVSGSLPPLQLSPSGLPGVQDGQPVVPEAPSFAYRLSGVIVGARPAAVFSDAQGAQRLITLGGSLDPDTKLIDVNRNAVRLRFQNKTLTLTLGGDSSE